MLLAQQAPVKISALKKVVINIFSTQFGMLGLSEALDYPKLNGAFFFLF